MPITALEPRVTKFSILERHTLTAKITNSLRLFFKRVHNSNVEYFLQIVSKIYVYRSRRMKVKRNISVTLPPSAILLPRSSISCLTRFNSSPSCADSTTNDGKRRISAVRIQIVSYVSSFVPVSLSLSHLFVHLSRRRFPSIHHSRDRPQLLHSFNLGSKPTCFTPTTLLLPLSTAVARAITWTVFSEQIAFYGRPA